MFPGSQIWRTGSPCDQTLQGNGSHLANPILRVGVGNIGRWSSPRHSSVHKARGWDMAVRAPQTQAEWACLSHDRMAPPRREFRSGSCPLSPSKYRTSLNPVSLRPRKQVGTGPSDGVESEERQLQRAGPGSGVWPERCQMDLFRGHCPEYPAPWALGIPVLPH